MAVQRLSLRHAVRVVTHSVSSQVLPPCATFPRVAVCWRRPSSVTSASSTEVDRSTSRGCTTVIRSRTATARACPTSCSSCLKRAAPTLVTTSASPSMTWVAHMEAFTCSSRSGKVRVCDHPAFCKKFPYSWIIGIPPFCRGSWRSNQHRGDVDLVSRDHAQVDARAALAILLHPLHQQRCVLPLLPLESTVARFLAHSDRDVTQVSTTSGRWWSSTRRRRLCPT